MYQHLDADVTVFRLYGCGVDMEAIEDTSRPVEYRLRFAHGIGLR